MASTTEQRIGKHGIVIPRIAIGEAERARLELAIGCAFLVKESGGGHNVFGHDPTIFAGAGLVTKAKYLAYKKLRGHTRMQGVGGTQLTWYSYQDAADALGGCWNPTFNTREGFRIIHDHVQRYGLWRGAYSYNGSGPAAVAYANSLVAIVHTWRSIVAGRTGAAALEKAAGTAQAEIDAAHAEHADELAATLNPPTPQSYLPKVYCWQARSIQAASSQRDKMLSFLHAHPKLKVYSGLRATEPTGDHRCGYALDLVPIDGTGKTGYAEVKAGYDDAVKRGYPYVEPLAQTWIPGNHHLHISFARCPR